MKCPYCSEELGNSPGAFCDFCGRELKLFDDSDNTVEIPMPVPGKQPPVQFSAGAVKKEPEVQIRPGRSASFDLGRMSDEILNAGPKQDDMPFISVSYATNRFLLAGGQMLLDLKVRLLRQGVRNIRCCMMSVIGKNTSLARVSCEELNYAPEAEITVSLYVDNDRINGMALLKFFFMMDTDDGQKCYRMDVRSRIYARGQSVQSVVMNLNADGGSVNDLSGIRNLTGICQSGDELLERANAEAPNYREFRIVELASMPDDVLVNLSAYVCDMLTLDYMGFKYHLCGKSEISVGRKWEVNDIALVDWVNTQSDRDELNRHTSKRHTQFHWNRDSVTLIDLSTNGTFVNGIRPEIGGNGGIDLPDQAELKMGNFKLAMTIQRCGSTRGRACCKGCEAAGVRAMTISRKDHVPEAFAFVWQCCDMGAMGLADSRGGLLIFRRNGGFFARLPDGRTAALCPGKNIPFGSGMIRVSDYRRDKFVDKKEY